jgi:Holliday junction DNA helicase RuvB
VVREDALTLYGFADDDERNTFELLQTASGIGPRLALAMLAVFTPDALRRAVTAEDLAALTTVPGVGRKGAQRIVLELAGRLGRPGDGSAGAAAAGQSAATRADPWREQVRAGLVNLTGSAGTGGAGTGSDSELDRFVSPLADADERVIEGALRPKRLAEFIGQNRVREQLSLVLEGALRRGLAPDHVLLSGPPGLGKTTIAMIIAAELGKPLRITSGPAIERSGDLAAVLSTLGEGEVIFIDEIHRVARPAQEMLYLAMEDFRVDVVVGKGPGATAIPLDIAPFTLVGATTRAGLLPAPLRDRFGFTARLDFYEPAELGVIVRRSAGLLGLDLRDEGADEIAGRSRGTPRIANRLLRRVRDFAEVRGDGVISRAAARAALELYEVDDSGLDRLDRGVLTALIRRFGGGPVGLSTLAVAVAEEAETVEVVAEPFLVRQGLIVRTPRGRVATPAAWQHLGLVPPAPGSDTATLFG